MKHVGNHEADVAHNLVQVAFAQEDILNKLVDTPGYDMQQRNANDAENFPGCYAVLFVGQMQHKRGGEQLSQLWRQEKLFLSQKLS